MIGVKFDGTRAVKAYQNAFRQLGSLPGFDHRQTLRAEAGSILKQWAGRTKVATQERADKRSRLAALKKLELTGGHGVTINAGVKGDYGRVFLRTRTGLWRRTHEAKFKPVAGHENEGKRKKAGDHYTEHDWLLLKSAISTAKATVPGYIKKGRGAIGLSRQSVVQIADALGINLVNVAGTGISAAGVAKARAAIASTGKAHANGVGYQGGSKIYAYVDLINRLPYGIKIGMDRTLAWVLTGRAKFIETAYAKGAFNSMSGVARAFPNIIRVRNQFANQTLQ